MKCNAYEKMVYVLEEHTWIVPSAYPRLCIEVSRQLLQNKSWIFHPERLHFLKN